VLVQFEYPLPGMGLPWYALMFPNAVSILTSINPLACFDEVPDP
jgi:hypothetical protein